MRFRYIISYVIIINQLEITMLLDVQINFLSFRKIRNLSIKEKLFIIYRRGFNR